MTKHSAGAGVTELIDRALRGELDNHVRVEASDERVDGRCRGTNVKIMASHDGEMRKMPSGEALSATEMVRGVIELAPTLNSIGSRWAFRAWSRRQADSRAAQSGRRLGRIRLRKGVWQTGPMHQRCCDAGAGKLRQRQAPLPWIRNEHRSHRDCRRCRCSHRGRPDQAHAKGAADGPRVQGGLKRYGQELWTEAVVEAVEILQNVIKPDETILGGGNAKLIDPLPAGCRCVDNRSAYIGAQRLWEGSDLFASACPTSWRIHRNEAHI